MYKSRIAAVKNNRNLTSIVSRALFSLITFVGCGGGEGYTIPSGFGNDEVSARDQVKFILDANSYTYSEDVNAQFRNLNDGVYFNNNYDIYATGPAGEEVYIEYNSQADGLTPVAEAGILSRAGTVPHLVVINPDDSLEIIDQKLVDVL